MTVIPRRTTRANRSTQPQGMGEIEATAGKWYTNYLLAKQIKEEQEGNEKAHTLGYRRWLLDRITKVGKVIDPKGHMAIVFNPPVNGLHGLKAQKSVSPDWQPIVAEGLLKKKGPNVLAACTRIDWAFRSDKLPDIVEALRTAGILEECVQEGYPMRSLDPDRVLRYHQLHKDELTEADIELMMPDSVTWSIHPLTEPLGEIGDDD